jgi:hypothetical protein
VRLNNLAQHLPRHHALHLLQELALARLLHVQLQAQTDLLHGLKSGKLDFTLQAPRTSRPRGAYADLP